MKKIIAKIAILAVFMAPIAIAVPAGAVTLPWDVTGVYTVAFDYDGTNYDHDMSLVQDSSGLLTGNGGSPVGANTYKWALTSGTVIDSSIIIDANYIAPDEMVNPLTATHMIGTINTDGTMSGAWSDDYQGTSREGNWSTTTGKAMAILPSVVPSYSIMYWGGKVNQHVDLVTGAWMTDPDGISGANIDPLIYCQKWYPQTVSTEQGIVQTINTWQDAGNVNSQIGTRLSTKCVQGTLIIPSPVVVPLTPVNLLSTSNFGILSETGITNTGSHTSKIIGNIGTGPITSASIDNVFCSEISGKIYGIDMAYTGSSDKTCFMGNPPMSNKTLVDNAVLDMVTAYNEAAGRTNPTATELGTGNIGGMTLASGLYKWSTGVTIPSDVTLSGGPNDIWIFQIAGDLSIVSAGSVASGVKVILAGGAKPSNVFWQVGGVTGATLGTYSTFNGNILTAKQIIIQTGAVLNGRALAQTQVTLDSNPITTPDFIPDTIGGTVIGGTDVGVLKVTGVDIVKNTATADGTFLNGLKYIFNITVPTNETHLSMKFINWISDIGSTIIPVVNNMRISSIQADNNLNLIVVGGTDTYTMPTLNIVSDMDSSVIGNQIQVSVEAAVPLNTVNGSYHTGYGVLSQ